jgi:putative transposase
MTTSARGRYAGYRFPAEIIGHAVWLYCRFPLGAAHVGELLAARGIIVSHETVRQWAHKFGQPFANQIRRRLPRVGDKWHLDEVVPKIAGESIGFGEPWTRPASCSTSWSNAAATSKRPSGCCASC